MSGLYFQDLLLDLVHTAWREKCIPKDWADAVIVPTPKKGDLSDSNNWRGIVPIPKKGDLSDCNNWRGIVPIPKKGDLSDCNNWRGISLFDVVGKVTARIL